ncbi:MAG: thioredoxin domain-containing protein [Candidatus Thorarchaeota archaeon]|jgi:thiol-disulfide isomerase/thioredoxin
MEPQRLAFVGITLTIVTVGLLIGASFMTFPPDDGGTPLTRYTTDTDLLDLGLSVPSAWSFEMSDGSTLELSDLSGQVVLVDLMATWCSTCKIQNGYLQTISEDLAGSITVISLSVDVYDPINNPSNI